MERVKGIEPSYEAWEAAVLPLNYTRVGIAQFTRSAADQAASGKLISSMRVKTSGVSFGRTLMASRLWRN